jgi:hypothetical protein
VGLSSKGVGHLVLKGVCGGELFDRAFLCNFDDVLIKVFEYSSVVCLNIIGAI